jgi:hypothetical protein
MDMVATLPDAAERLRRFMESAVMLVTARESIVAVPDVMTQSVAFSALSVPTCATVAVSPVTNSSNVTVEFTTSFKTVRRVTLRFSIVAVEELNTVIVPNAPVREVMDAATAPRWATSAVVEATVPSVAEPATMEPTEAL